MKFVIYCIRWDVRCCQIKFSLSTKESRLWSIDLEHVTAKSQVCPGYSGLHYTLDKLSVNCGPLAISLLQNNLESYWERDLRASQARNQKRQSLILSESFPESKKFSRCSKTGDGFPLTVPLFFQRDIHSAIHEVAIVARHQSIF